MRFQSRVVNAADRRLTGGLGPNAPPGGCGKEIGWPGSLPQPAKGIHRVLELDLGDGSVEGQSSPSKRPPW